MKWEALALQPTTGKSDGDIYSLWSRFEALTVMVGRADKLFGSMVVLCQGYLFSNICGCVYYLKK